MESIKLSISDVLNRLNSKPQLTKEYRTRLAEVYDPYRKFIFWENSTFFDDETLIFIWLQRYMRCHTWAELENKLNWVKEVNSLKPRQFVKSLVNSINKKI